MEIPSPPKLAESSRDPPTGNDDEKKRSWDEDKAVNAALTAVSAGLESWLGAHPETRVRMTQSKCWGYIDRSGRDKEVALVAARPLRWQLSQ